MIKFETREEWLKWRKTGWGGSDAGILWGESEYTTRYELGRQKLDPEVKETPANIVQQKGNDREPIARMKFAALYNILHGTNETFEAAAMEMSGLPFMKCSLDGISSDGTQILEIKSMSDAQSDEDKFKRKKLTKGQEKHLAVTQGIVPKLYWMQCQHNLLVSGAKVCHFVSFDGVSLTTCEIFPDTAWMKLHLELCEKYWTMIENEEDLPPSEGDYGSLRFAGAKRLAQQYREAYANGSDDQLRQIRMQIASEAGKDGRKFLKLDGMKVEDII